MSGGLKTVRGSCARDASDLEDRVRVGNRDEVLAGIVADCPPSTDRPEVCCSSAVISSVDPLLLATTNIVRLASSASVTVPERRVRRSCRARSAGIHPSAGRARPRREGLPRTGCCRPCPAALRGSGRAALDLGGRTRRAPPRGPPWPPGRRAIPGGPRIEVIARRLRGVRGPTKTRPDPGPRCVQRGPRISGRRAGWGHVA